MYAPALVNLHTTFEFVILRISVDTDAFSTPIYEKCVEEDNTHNRTG